MVLDMQGGFSGMFLLVQSVAGACSLNAAMKGRYEALDVFSLASLVPKKFMRDLHFAGLTCEACQ